MRPHPAGTKRSCPQRKPKTKKTFACKSCGKTFTSKQVLIKHSRCHCGELQSVQNQPDAQMPGPSRRFGMETSGLSASSDLNQSERGTIEFGREFLAALEEPQGASPEASQVEKQQERQEISKVEAKTIDKSKIAKSVARPKHVCDICGKEVSTLMALGAHKRFKHNVRGKTKTRGATTGTSGTAPATEPRDANRPGTSRNFCNRSVAAAKSNASPEFKLYTKKYRGKKYSCRLCNTIFKNAGAAAMHLKGKHAMQIERMQETAGAGPSMPEYQVPEPENLGAEMAPGQRMPMAQPEQPQEHVAGNRGMILVPAIPMFNFIPYNANLHWE